jgi:hypothetical protein
MSAKIITPSNFVMQSPYFHYFITGQLSVDQRVRNGKNQINIIFGPIPQKFIKALEFEIVNKIRS